MLAIIGIGPGVKEYMLPKAVETARQAEVLIGGKRALTLFQDHPGEKKEVTGQIVEIIEFIKANLHKKIAVLVSGDPGFHSLLPVIKKNLPGVEIEVIPGLSSIQMAYARLARPWHDAKLVSLHGKELNMLKNYLNAPNLALLTDPANCPSRIARYWLANGGKDCPVYVCKHLSYPEEKVEQYLMSELASLTENTSCVMVINNGYEF